MKNTHPSFMRPSTPEHNCHRCHRSGHETSTCRSTTTAYGIQITDDTDSEEETTLNPNPEFIGPENQVEQVEPATSRRRASSTNECITCGIKIEHTEECLNCTYARFRLSDGIRKLRARYRHDIRQIRKNL